MIIVIDAFAIAIILLAIYHPSLIFVLLAVFAILMAIGFALCALQDRSIARKMRRENAHRAKLWRIIEEDNARP